MLTESNPTLTGAADCPDPHQSQPRESMSGSGYPKFKNDRGVPEICIGVRDIAPVSLMLQHRSRPN